MLFDIPVNIKVIADNELEAEKLIKDIMDDLIRMENKLKDWDYLEFISSPGYGNYNDQ